ncbi:MAG TPA: class IV adenylate cyclase, partial [Chloroflexota bacterium]
MPRNIEIKARITSAEGLIPRVQAVADQGPFELHQDDTYFLCSSGKLKLRAFSESEGELIYYRRDSQLTPKESFYVRAATTVPGALREALSLAYGQIGRVRKHRTVFLVGRTRIHLDRVTDLGHFLELEVVLGENEPSAAGIGAA